MSECNYEIRFRDQRWETEESPTPNTIRDQLCEIFGILPVDFHDWAMENCDEKVIMIRKSDGFQISHSLYIMTRFKDYKRVPVIINKNGEVELIEENK